MKRIVIVLTLFLVIGLTGCINRYSTEYQDVRATILTLSSSDGIEVKQESERDGELFRQQATVIIDMDVGIWIQISEADHEDNILTDTTLFLDGDYLYDTETMKKVGYTVMLNDKNDIYDRIGEIVEYVDFYEIIQMSLTRRLENYEITSHRARGGRRFIDAIMDETDTNQAQKMTLIYHNSKMIQVHFTCDDTSLQTMCAYKKRSYYFIQPYEVEFPALDAFSE